MPPCRPTRILVHSMSQTRIVPERLFGNPEVSIIASGGHSSILYKTSTESKQAHDVYTKLPCLTVITCGEKLVHTYSGERYRIGPSGFLFLPADLYSVSDIVPASGGRFESYLFFFSRSTISQFLFQIEKSPRQKPSGSEGFGFQSARAVRGFCDALAPVLRPLSDKGRQRILPFKMLELLHIADAESGGEFGRWLAGVQNLAPRPRSIVEFMEKNFDKDLSIEDYAALTGRSVSTFQRDFRRWCKTSPRKWITAKRMELGRELLRSGKSVTDTALAVGYESVSQFAKVFRQTYSLSPKEFASSHEAVVAHEAVV